MVINDYSIKCALQILNIGGGTFNVFANFTKTCQQIGVLINSINSKERPKFMSSFCKYFFPFKNTLYLMYKVGSSNCCVKSFYITQTDFDRLIKISIKLRHLLCYNGRHCFFLN